MGWLAIASGVAFGLAMTFLGGYFATRDARLDRLAEWAFVAFAIAGVPTALVVADRTATVGWPSMAIAGLGVLGIAGIGLGELALTLRIVGFARMAPAVTGSFVAILAWMGGVSVIAIGEASLPVGLGWLGLSALAVGGLIVGVTALMPGAMLGETRPPRWLVAASLVPLAGITGWMVWLGIGLL